ncbi:Crp/Fnr family transcriptional regulator [Undibacterium danionis]|uniref:Crp/Fnr family transcriptional regulator n=1 Tax=Undibacterium danionis TaxID=1812100 RepID=A0ABV6IAM8_9BURK
MKHHLTHRRARQIEAREELSPQDLGLLWRIEAGTMRIDSVSEDGSLHFVRLAIAGDILGMENVAGVTEKLAIRALTPTRLVPLNVVEAPQLTPLLLESLSKAHQRCREVVSLRTGAIEDRIKRLLRILSVVETDSDATATCNLPSLGNIAEIVHSTPETVCRVLASLRKQHVLEKTTPSNIRSKGLDFHQHKIATHALAA